MFLVDSHCHLDSLDYETVHPNVQAVINRACALGVTHMLSVGVDLVEFSALYDLVKDLPGVYTAAGLHPENLTLDNKNWREEELAEFLGRPKVIALGETGLDYINTPETATMQKESFARQVAVGASLDKPLIIHGRGAMKDCMDIISFEGKGKSRGVMHCFCDDIAQAKRALDMGFYISFSGIVSFKKALNVQETCRYVPLDRMLVETDSPYLAPVPMRGHPNEPGYVSYTAAAVAALHNTTKERVCETTAQNFAACFGVDLEQESLVAVEA